MGSPSIPLADLAGPFGRTLRADGKAASTIDRYVGTLEMLTAHLPDGVAVDDVTRHHLRDWMVDLRDQGYADSSLSSFYRALQQFWKWAILDEYIEADANPMVGLKAPKVAEKAVPLLTDEEIETLLRLSAGTDFQQRRDHAIVRVLLDTGIRRGELVALSLDDLDLPDGRRGSAQWGTLLIRSETSKGDRDRAVPLAVKTMRALDKYLPVRAAYPPAEMTNRLFLGQRGPMHPNGLGQAIRRLGQRAGIEGLHAHQFRHTYAHRFLLEGGNEHDLMQLAGWRAPQMVARYGAAGRQERAFANFRSLGDRF
jgi:site-specific recombinase XerD